MNRNPNIDKLHLRRCKKLKGSTSGLEYELFENYVDKDGNPNQRKYLGSDTREITSEMHQALNSLKPFIMEIYRFKDIDTVVCSKQFESTEKQSKYVKKTLAQISTSVKINGVAVSGSEENPVVVINATLKTPSGMVVAINSHALKLDKDNYGFAEKIREIIMKIKTECYEYVFNQKTGDGLFDEIDEDE